MDLINCARISLIQIKNSNCWRQRQRRATCWKNAISKRVTGCSKYRGRLERGGKEYFSSLHDGQHYSWRRSGRRQPHLCSLHPTLPTPFLTFSLFVGIHPFSTSVVLSCLSLVLSCALPSPRHLFLRVFFYKECVLFLELAFWGTVAQISRGHCDCIGKHVAPFWRRITVDRDPSFFLTKRMVIINTWTS